MIQRIIKIIEQYLEPGIHNITEETNLKEDLGLDSFDIMNIVIECDEEFGTRISDEVIGSFITVKDIKRALLQKKAEIQSPE